MPKREKGRIKKWNDRGGYGFAQFEGYSKDVFIHISEFEYKGIKSSQIKDNDEIECEIIKTQKGLKGKNISLFRLKDQKNTKDDKFMDECYVPKDTKEILDLKECENMNLLINKYPEFEDGKANLKANYKYINSMDINKLGIKEKNNEIDKEWRKVFKSINNIYIKRIRELLSGLQSSSYVVRKRQYEINWRLVTGLGEASVYETSMKLHHIYGFPFIPASTFKGTIRSWVINNYFAGNEKEALKDGTFSNVFGSPKTKELDEQSGNINFFDVYPIHCPHIKLDIINTHYSEYYQNGITSPPGDYYNPNMVNFLTVTDTTFEFTYGYDSDFCIENLTNTKFKGNTEEIINKWIDEALNYQGIGAKTSAGYGYFTMRSQ